MTDFDPVVWTLSVHGTLAVLALAGHRHYSDQPHRLKVVDEGVDPLLVRLRAHMGDSLAELLTPVFRRAPGAFKFESTSQDSPLLLPVGFTEEPSSPVGSEAYNEAIRRFLEAGGDSSTSMHWALCRARDRWCFCSCTLGWMSLLLLIWELACSALFGVGALLAGIKLPNWATAWSFLPTGCLVLAVIVLMIVSQASQDRILFVKRYCDGL